MTPEEQAHILAAWIIRQEAQLAQDTASAQFGPVTPLRLIGGQAIQAQDGGTVIAPFYDFSAWHPLLSPWRAA